MNIEKVNSTLQEAVIFTNKVNSELNSNNLEFNHEFYSLVKTLEEKFNTVRKNIETVLTEKIQNNTDEKILEFKDFSATLKNEYKRTCLKPEEFRDKLIEKVNESEVNSCFETKMKWKEIDKLDKKNPLSGVKTLIKKYVKEVVTRKIDKINKLEVKSIV